MNNRAYYTLLLASFLAPLPGRSQSCISPPSGLVGWWPAEGTAQDLRSTNAGTLNGGVAYAIGTVGQAFSFDGASGFVELPNSPALTPTGSFSIEAWVYPNTGDPGVILSKWGDNNQRCYTFEIKANGVYNFPMTDAAHQNDALFHTFSTAPGTVVAGQWAHVAAVYDQSAGTRKIYVNGLKLAQRTDSPITVLDGLPESASVPPCPAWALPRLLTHSSTDRSMNFQFTIVLSPMVRFPLFMPLALAANARPRFRLPPALPFTPG